MWTVITHARYHCRDTSALGLTMFHIRLELSFVDAIAPSTTHPHTRSPPAADGLGNAEIAERLHVSIATVKAHTGNLFTKLALENRVQIALLIRDAEE